MKKKRMTPEETKQNLIFAGLHLFGLKGLEATRTRELAEMAGVNQAAIPYHFGGKEALYLAVAEYVVQRGQEDLKDSIVKVKARLESGNVSPHEAGQMFCSVLDAFVDRIVSAEDINDRSRFVMREYTTPGAGFEIIYEGLLEKIHKVMCSLVGIAEGKDPQEERIILKTHTLFGTVLSNVVARSLLFKRLGWDGYDTDKLDKIKLVVRDVVSHGLQLETKNTEAS